MISIHRYKPSIYLFLCGIFILLLVGFVYWPGLHGPFFLDDLQSIEPTALESFSWSKLIEISLQNDTGPLGRPVSVFTFALNQIFFGTGPFSFKATNLAIHLLIGISIGIFIYLLVLLQPRVKRLALPMAFITATLWLVHPLQVSTVLYPVQRMTQLCHLFTLLGLNTYLFGRLRLYTQQSHAILFLGLSFGLFYPLAIFSKETGIIFPWYLICIEYFMLRFHCQQKSQQYYLTHFHSILSLSLLLGAFLYYWSQLNKFLFTFAEKNITLWDRLLTQIKALVFYMKLTLIPQLEEMGLYHDDFPISRNFDTDLIFASIILFCCMALIYLLRKRAPVIAFGFAWFFVSHSIESTAIPLELVFEHRNYLASVGLLFIPVYYLIRFIYKSSLPTKWISIFFTATTIVLLLALTYLRSVAWSTPLKFLSNELYNHPNSARVHIEVANLFLQKEQYEQAFNQLDIAKKIEPYNAGIVLHEILIFCRAQSIPPQLYEIALQKIRQSAITPYVILTLDQIVQNMFNQSCSAVDKNKMIAIINSALQNPFLKYKPLYKAVLFHLLSGLELLNHNVDQSRMLLFKSFETYPKRLDPLIQKAYLEMQFHLYTEAEKTLNKIHEHVRFLRSPSSKIAKLEQTMEKLKHNGVQATPALKGSNP